ncbi:LA2681 family HEPN domain-containing protein [Primorskyibacter sp. 2E107]|uniref:LA2681 family HEPN domain-containing protein n=1 Tax=Primorskyibacter sp. 2E107 TaxID=3403458 RepID=UPI003AF632D0
MERRSLIEELHALADEDPAAALARIRELGDSAEEAFASAAILIDCGGHLGNSIAINRGVEILEELRKDSEPDPGLAYNLANGLQTRARLVYGPCSPYFGQSFEDHFQARIRFGEAARSPHAPFELASQALTNMGTLFQDTSRWIEALDCFREAQNVYPKNAVAMLKELTLLQKLGDLFQSDPHSYQCYGHIPTIVDRIRILAGNIDRNLGTLIAFSGTAALPFAQQQIAMAKALPSRSQGTIDKPYFQFVSKNQLALFLHCSAEGFEAGIFDVLTIPTITRTMDDEDGVPEIYAMLNVMKTDFAFARQVYFEVLEDDADTPYFETTTHGDTLDYALYGVRYSALTSAQRIAFDILDKVAVAIAFYLKIPKAHKVSFATLWGRTEKGGSFRIHDEIARCLSKGNFGLIALHNIFHDMSSDNSRGVGIMEAHKSYRNSSTHRFTVLHDFGKQERKSPSLAVDHQDIMEFERMTLDSLKLARSVIFYFVDMIMFAEASRPKRDGGITVPMSVPDHAYIRGRYD